MSEQVSDIADEDDEALATMVEKPSSKCLQIRRKIEEALERRRFREEFGEDY